jgi:hypothetical protein
MNTVQYLSVLNKEGSLTDTSLEFQVFIISSAAAAVINYRH